MYTIAELVKAAAQVGFSGYLIEAALKNEKKKYFTLEEAKEIVQKFADQPVK